MKSAFSAGVSHAGVADIIGKSLSGQIDSIQVCPGEIIRVSFLDPQSKKSYEEAGSISFEDVCCQVLCSTPVTHVLVYLFPFEGSNDHVKEALKYFGEIKEVKFQQWTNVPGVATGTRIVRMVRKHEIPRNIVIDGVKCRVWYKGQPLVCNICSNNHKAADCPLRGKCRRCHQAGHFVRACPKPVWYVPGREDNPPSASSVAPPSGEGSTPVGGNITVVPDEDGEVPVSVALSFSFVLPDSVPMGPGLWKLNLLILEEDKYVSLLTAFWLFWQRCQSGFSLLHGGGTLGNPILNV